MAPSWLDFLTGSEDPDPEEDERPLIYSLDDDGNTRELIKEILEGYGYRAETFWSGPELFDGLREEIPDVILLDINMPVESGWKIRQKLAKYRETHQIPVIAVTGTRTPNAEAIAREKLEFSDFLKKPFQGADLIEKIQDVLEDAPAPEHDDVPGEECSPTEVPREEGQSAPSAERKQASKQPRPKPRKRKGHKQPPTREDPGPTEPTPSSTTADPQRGPEVPTSETYAEDEPLEPKLVYVAGRDESARDLAGEGLEDHGHEVEVFKHGTSLLARMAEQSPDLLVLDLMMPGPEGASVVGKLLRSPTRRDVPVLGMTQRGSEQVANLMTWLLGIEDCLHGELDPQRLVERVDEVFAEPEDPSGSTHGAAAATAGS